jgi:hypothetical protein
VPEIARQTEQKGEKMEQDHRSAPNPIVTLADGAQTHLSRLWQDQPLVLVFLRHFG